MKLHKLAWRGIGRFDVDCSLPIDQLGDAALVSISGVNGAGKTTAIEMLPAVLYRDTPSRGPIARLANRRDSMITADITTTKRFELRLLLDGVTKAGKSEGVVMPGSDSGKIKDYDAAIAKLVPPMDLFLASGFQTQGGKGRFLDLSASERREMFAGMLGLSGLQVISDKAAARLAATETAIATLRGQIQALEQQAAEVPTEKLAEANQVSVDAVAARCDAEDAEVSTRSAAESARIALVKSEQSMLAAEQDYRRQSEAKRVAEASVENLADRIEQLQKGLAGKTELELLAMGLPEIQVEINRLEDKIAADMEAERNENLLLTSWSKRLADLEGAGKDLKHEVEQIEQWIARAEKAKANISEVPCGAADKFSACQFLRDVVEMRKEYPAKVLLLETAREKLALARMAYSDHKAIKPSPTVRTSQQEKLVNARRARNSAQDAETALAGMAAVETELLSRKKELEVAKATFSGLTVKDDRGVVRKACEAAKEIERLADREHATAVSRLTGARASERDAHTAVARLEAAVESATAASGKCREAQEKLTATMADVDDWKHLAVAFGPKGIQALEIDAAGPEVSSLTNELLSACYGSRFTVSLETTALKADGKSSKEVFELRVLDNERGTDLPAGDLSGGEKVLVSECLAMALAIFNLQKSDIPILTCFRDEVSGALDADNAGKYIAMLRKAIELGHLERVFFIAHQAELWALADARIVFANGGSHVE